ncbi:MAG TPA: BON domain-containing protein [Candidatus Binataceae bacterium]|nr:BON domain-containing protein [Candidatus Binataceae bacterium]
MKICPRCDKTYPDSETFCADDGTALVAQAPAFTQSGAKTAAGASAKITCPSCGGTAEPGEVFCNFCGHRLIEDDAPRPASSAAATPPRTAVVAPPPPRPADPGLSGRFTGKMPDTDVPTGGRSGFNVAFYILAAVIALGGGAWLALHLSSGGTGPEAEASPAAGISAMATPLPAVPMAVLAQNIPIEVTGEAANAPERNLDASRAAFNATAPPLLDAYKSGLSSDDTLHDAMILRARVMPDGTLGATAVQTSTTPNPGLDASVVKAASAMKFPSFSGSEVEVSFPVIFARTDAERSSLEEDLKAKLAGANPAEPPEYALAPESSPAASAAPSEAAGAPVVSPEAAVTPEAAPSAVAPEMVAKPKPRRHAAKAAPTPSMLERVQTALSSDRRLNRVKAYTDGGTVTLYGRVFDDNAKLVAERTVRNVAGVTNVVDTLNTDVAQWAAEQAQIQQQLANAGLPNVTVKVIGNDAYLNGTVKTDLEKQRAVTIAMGAAPVTVRVNLIRIVPGNMFGF